MMPYLTFNFYPTVMVEKNDNAFCDHSAFAFNFGSIDQVAVGHGLKMTKTILNVYSILLFSVDFEENPMFMRVKQWSLFCDQHELGEELDLRTAVDLSVVDPAVDHGVPFGLADAQLGVQADYFDFDGWLGFVEETHR